MKKLIKKLLIFIITVLLIAETVNFAYMKRREPDPDGTNKFSSIPDKIQICNFGTSYGGRFNYKDLENEYDCFNFALSSQSPSYDYRLFQYYGDHIVDGAVVFIPIAYFSLFGIEETRREDFLSKNGRYYSILPPSLIKEYDYRAGVYARYFPALTANTGKLIVTLLGETVRDNFEEYEKVTTDIEVGKTVKARVYHLLGDERVYYDTDGNRIENREEIGALYALIRGCQEKGAIPILITTPHLHEFTDAVREVAEDFYDQFYAIIDEVVRDTGVDFYDYAFDERFVSEYSLFSDSDHLNKEGGRVFVDILMQETVYAKGYYPDK